MEEVCSVFNKSSRENNIDTQEFKGWLKTYIYVQNLFQLSFNEKLNLKSTADIEIIRSDQVPKNISAALISIFELITLMVTFSMEDKKKEHVLRVHGISVVRLENEMLKVVSVPPPE